MNNFNKYSDPNSITILSMYRRIFGIKLKPHCQMRVSIIGSLNVGFKLSPICEVFAEPSLKVQTTTMTTNQYPLSQSYTTFGASTGIRLAF